MSDAMVRCAGILLTGGASRRFGRDKARVEVEGATMAARAAAALRATCRPVVEVGAGVTGLPSIREAPAGAGPLAALVAGADAVGHAPVVLLAVDLPRVDDAIVACLRDAPGGGTVVPRVGGRPQWACARYAAVTLARARLRHAAGASALRDLAGPEIAWLDDPDWAGALLDVDDDADLARLVAGPARAAPAAAGPISPSGARTSGGAR